MGKESCAHGKIIPPVLPPPPLDLEQARGPKPAEGLLGSGEPSKPVINFPVLISSRISPSHYEAVRQWVVRDGAACLPGSESGYQKAWRW